MSNMSDIKYKQICKNRSNYQKNRFEDPNERAKTSIVTKQGISNMLNEDNNNCMIIKLKLPENVMQI